MMLNNLQDFLMFEVLYELNKVLVKLKKKLLRFFRLKDNCFKLFISKHYVFLDK